MRAARSRSGMRCTATGRAACIGRKGMVFLITALLFVGVFLTIFFARTRPTQIERQESVVTRISSIDDFLKDFHNDVHRATYISGFRGLIALEEHISEEGTFLTNASPAFIEVFMNGTIDGDAYEVMTNSSFANYLARVNAEAQRIGIAVNVSVADIALSQSTPWSVDVTFDLVVNVTDMRGLVRWDYVKPFTTEVSILDLRDPTYSVGTFGRLPNTFRISPYNESDLVLGNDTTALNEEALAMYYREDPLSPSFLQRVTGNLTGRSKYGIASLVNLGELNAQGLTVNPALSVVDAAYFSGFNTTTYCPAFGGPLPAWLRLDAAHVSDAEHDYGLQKLNATVC